MMVQTEIGLLPEDWEVQTIGDVFKLSAAGDLRESLFSLGRSSLYCYPVYSNSIIHKGLYGYTSSPRYKRGCITITGRGTLGHAEYREIDFDAIIRLLILQPKIDINGYLITAFINKKKPFFFESTSIPQLTVPQIRDVFIPIPPKSEQQNIASALSSIDKLIDDLGRTIQKKQLIREGAMEELLSGKKRLPGFTEEWVEKKIGEVCNTASGGTPSRSNPNYYTGKIKWFTTAELNDGWLLDSMEHISEEAIKNSSVKIFKEGTLLMAMYGATIGKLGILSSEAATNQACCAFESKEMDLIYLFYFLFAKRQQILSLGAGAGQPNISQQIIKNIPINIPHIREQHAIANILTSMDDEISVLQIEKTKYEQIRSGMMEELLTGKKRLIKK